MICEKYSNLSIQEKIKFIGSITHICMSDDYFFDLANAAIEKASQRGVMDGITILPEPTEQPLN